MTEVVTILCSGFGLGFYIPGLLIAQKLKRLGQVTDVEVFENLLTEDKKLMSDESRKAYAANFAFAIASQKIPGNIRKSLDSNKVEALIVRWLREGRKRFICLSGHWVHILDEFRKLAGGDVVADLLYVDSDLSPSWKQLRKQMPNYAACYREVGLYDPIGKKTKFRIDVDVTDPVPFPERNGRLVVHGGGWGIGTFRQSIQELEQAGYSLDVVAYGLDDITVDTAGRRYFMNDPDWRAWIREEGGSHTFPPFARVDQPGNIVYSPGLDYHGLYGVIRKSTAVISKPGAGALIDSLASATPLVLLEPFGQHEKVNADVWESEGFGIRYERWREGGYEMNVLQKLQHNLVIKRAQIPDYATCMASGMTLVDGRG